MSATRAEKLDIWNQSCAAALCAMAQTSLQTGRYVHPGSTEIDAPMLARDAAKVADHALTEWLDRWGP